MTVRVECEVLSQALWSVQGAGDLLHERLGTDCPTIQERVKRSLAPGRETRAKANRRKSIPGTSHVDVSPSKERSAEAGRREVEEMAPGITREAQEPLWGPFSNPEPESTGLGLPIAARMVDKHGGGLESDTQLDSGAIFPVLLPVSRERGTHAYTSEDSPGGGR